MILLLFIIILVVIFAVLSKFLNTICFKMTDLLSSTYEDTTKRQLLKEMKGELSKLNMVSEFAQYARLERRINGLTEDFKSKSKKKQDTFWKISIAANILFYVSQVLIFGSLLICYRSVPLLQLPEEWVFPCGYILAFPSGIPGAVGVTVWIVVCRNVVSKVSAELQRLLNV